MVQYLIVGVIVLCAALYAVKMFAPRALRERLFGKGSAKAGCDSGCSNCGDGCDTPLTPPEGKSRVIPLRQDRS
ncbi:MAG: hypothetical protein ACLGI6_13595 [Gammaproteobacteria bacterium]